MLTLTDLDAAAAIVYQAMGPTPQQRWPLLDARAGAQVWVKHENQTPVGAFKIRGGLVYLDALRREAPAVKGIVAATRGNHGQSIGFAARRLGIPVAVVAPHGNSTSKNAAMKALGVELIEEGHDFQASIEAAERIARDRGWHMVPSFDPRLVQGVASYVLELFRAVPDLDTLYVPIGLGSGICGAIAARHALGRRTKIVAVVAASAPAYARSLALGRLVSHDATTRIADGIACRTPVPDALDQIRAGVERVVEVTDDQIEAAMRAIYDDTHNVAEGAAASSVAALLSERDRIQGLPVGVVLTGANVDRDVFARVLAGRLNASFQFPVSSFQFPLPASSFQLPSLYTSPMKKWLIGGLLVLPVLLVAQRGGQFPGGLNPDGSLRPSAPVGRLFSQDAYTEYALLEPGSEAFRITFLPEQSRAGATELVNATRGGSEGSGVEVYDPRTGEPLKFVYEPSPNDPESHQIRATLPRPVPEGGIGRVLIYKTYKDPRTYMMAGKDIVWVRSLSGYRLGVVLPKGFAFISSDVAAQVTTTADGRLKLAFANPSGQSNPVTIHARPTTAQFKPSHFDDMFFDDIKTLYDLDAPETGRIAVEQTYSDYRKGDRARLDSLGYLALQDLKVVDLDTAKPFTPVKEAKGTFVKLDVPIASDKQSAHIRITGTLKASGYTVVNGELVFQRTLKGLRNTVLLPTGWEVSGVSESATIGTERASGRAFVALINLNAENSYKVTIRARKASAN